MMFAMFLGAGMFSFVVGTCCSLIENLDRASIEFQQEFDTMNDYCEICNIPPAMRRRVRAYMNSGREIANRKNEQHILSLVSPALQVTSPSQYPCA